MPIKPPNLDDRRYDDLVREARALIPQYCPDWTQLSDADPGMTLVQLFAWMTEMTLYRLNRVPDKTYVHFLNFIGEERRGPRPATVPVTFTLRGQGRGVTEIAAFSRVSSRQGGTAEALHFLTSDALTVHDATIDRIVAVRGGDTPAVREIRPDIPGDQSPQVISLGQGRGVQPFRIDPVLDGPDAYTAQQYLYLGHDDFAQMDFVAAGGRQPGRILLRTGGDVAAPLADLFRWEFPTAEGWVPLATDLEADEVLGLPDVSVAAHLPGHVPVAHFGDDDDPVEIPGPLAEQRHWIRGVVDYERWLAARMVDDLEIAWQDDRGGEPRPLNDWDVRNTGRTLEFSVQDVPPIRPGWTIRLNLVHRGMPAGRSAYLPRYRFSYRRGDAWEPISDDRVRLSGTTVELAGPLSDLAAEGVNLRAERVEAVFLPALIPELQVDATWLRPVQVHLAAGPETEAAETIDRASLPRLPFQGAATLPPLMGMKLFIGSDLFENRAARTVLIELELSFQSDGEPVLEPDGYHLQLTYRASDTWRVVHTHDGRFAKFTLAELDPEGIADADLRRIRILVDPAENLKGFTRSAVGGIDTSWLRLELTRAPTVPADPRSGAPSVSIVLHAVRVGVDGMVGQATYPQAMPRSKTAAVEVRGQNRRLSRVIVRSGGQLEEHHPFDTFMDLHDEAGGHAALYLRLTRPLPGGVRHAIVFRCLGQVHLPPTVQVTWEQLADAGSGRVRWHRLVDHAEAYKLDRSGLLEFPYPQAVASPTEGAWLRALFRVPAGTALPALPPISHIMLNTVEAVNLHRFETERFSGQWVAHQTLQLRRFPLYIHGPDVFPHPDRFADIVVRVTEDDGEVRQWRKAPGNALASATKDDPMFTVDPVDGSLTFGNGIHGRMLPVGQHNVAVERYHVVPGEAGNVGPGRVTVAEGLDDRVSVTNPLPAHGGRDAESIDEIVRRAPSVLTSRDRAVTRGDFEVIAVEASAAVARAWCRGTQGPEGEVEVVVLPHRRPGEALPDPFLAGGIEAHVQHHLAQRCLVNVQPVVRLATFQPVDVALTLRLRPNAHPAAVQQKAEAWVRRFLDPYEGGLDGTGWPFGATLFAADFGRIVADLDDVRHVASVEVFAVAPGSADAGPAWQRERGSDSLVPDRHDLVALRQVRVIIEEGA